MDLKKQQRLAAWRQKQQQQIQQPLPLPPVAVAAPLPPVKVSWNAAVAAASKLRKKKRKLVVDMATTTNETNHSNLKRNPFDEDDDEDDDNHTNSNELNQNTSFEALPQPSIRNEEEPNRPPPRKRNRWDTNTTATTDTTTNTNSQPPHATDVIIPNLANSNKNEDVVVDDDTNQQNDTLDQFMAQLHSVASDDAVVKIGNSTIHLSGSVQRTISMPPQPLLMTTPKTDVVDLNVGHPANNFSAISQNTTTTRPHHSTQETPSLSSTSASNYNPNDWLSDVNPNTDNEEEADTDMEDEQRWELIKALKQEQQVSASSLILDETSHLNTAALTEGSKSSTSVTDDKLSFREQHQKMVQELAEAAKQVRDIQQKNVQEIGREFFVPEDDGIVEEAIREYEAATQQQSDSTFMLLSTVDQTLNKKKELTSHHHHESGEALSYAPFQKNIYRVAKSVASLTTTEITNRRAKLKIRVRGVQVPAPVLQFHEMGLPESVLQYMTQHHTPPIATPYPIQAQCIPCILAGRDVIGIAKTGSGKTLAYVLPMLRHIIIQPPLALGGSSSSHKSSSSAPSSSRGETGPIALILVPARELAFQIHSVCKPYGKLLGLK